MARHRKPPVATRVKLSEYKWLLSQLGERETVAEYLRKIFRAHRYQVLKEEREARRLRKLLNLKYSIRQAAFENIFGG